MPKTKRHLTDYYGDRGFISGNPVMQGSGSGLGFERSSPLQHLHLIDQEKYKKMQEMLDTVCNFFDDIKADTEEETLLDLDSDLEKYWAGRKIELEKIQEQKRKRFIALKESSETLHCAMKSYFKLVMDTSLLKEDRDYFKKKLTAVTAEYNEIVDEFPELRRAQEYPEA